MTAPRYTPGEAAILAPPRSAADLEREDAPAAQQAPAARAGQGGEATEIDDLREAAVEMAKDRRTAALRLAHDLRAAIARQQTEHRLLAAIEHQALLTREVSHRVKNSLSLVSSLLSMQARGAPSDEVRAALATGRPNSESEKWGEISPMCSLLAIEGA